MLCDMTNKVKEAIEVLRSLPEDDQDTVAAAIIDFASRDEHLTLSDEQVAEVERRIAKPNRTFVSIPEARKRLRHFGV
jgi:hypothetical protein